MAVDVFIRTSCPVGMIEVPFRKSIREACLWEWNVATLPGSPNLIVPTKAVERFGMYSKKMAEELATTETYILADEDTLPFGNDFVDRGADILERHPEYGILTATSICDGLFPAGARIPDAEVVEAHSVGGVAFVRKGILTEFADCRPDQVDDVVCSEMNRKGYKTGVMPGVRFNHLGCGFSIYQRPEVAQAKPSS